MSELLEKAPRNRSLEIEFDQLLKEYAAVSKARNELAHGKWFSETKEEDTETYLARFPEARKASLKAKKITSKEVKSLVLRAMDLENEVYRIYNDHQKALKEQMQ